MSHKERMKEIGRWVIPPEGTPARQTLNKAIEKQQRENPQFDAEVKKLHERAVALAIIQNVNGAGLPLDEMIREYNTEYNHRSFIHSLRDMPTSFNVMEAFNRFLLASATFRVLKEKDYLLSFIDFIDYVTSDESDQNVSSSLDLLEEGTIYSFNGIHNLNDITFDCGGKDFRFGVAGVSLIRHGCEVSVMMLAGELCDLEKKTIELKEIWSTREILPHRAHIEPDEELEIQAVPLEKSECLWKTVVMSRIDLNADSLDVRYVAQDAGNSFIARTDDLSVYIDSSGEFFSSKAKDIAVESSKKLDEYQPLFEFIKVCLNLPAYAQAREESTRIERHPTQFKSMRGKPKHRKLEKLAPSKERVAIRDVTRILVANEFSPTRRTFFAPNIRAETSGFWKTLPIDVVGQDKAGQPIHGRTWVEKTITWVEESGSEQPLCTRNVAKQVVGENPGTIYVMRSAAHEKNIFKVGLTTRTADIRAEELTRTTGSPDHYLVVEEWEVPDCKLAEKLIHKRLAEYRLNPRREFFRTRYSVIFAAVSEVVKELGTDL